MTTLTVELPEEETELFKQLLKKLNGRVLEEKKTPNAETLKAMEELKSGKGKKFDSVKELFKSI